MDYQVLSSTSPGTLALLVKELVTAGWEPLGGVSAISGYSGSVLFQAMIKFSDKRTQFRKRA